MKYIILAIIALLAFSFLMVYRNAQDPADKAFSVVMRQHIDKQRKKNDFRPWATGGGGGPDLRYRHLSLDFNTRDPLTIDEARKYLVEGVMGFYVDINEHEEFKDHYIEWPFPIERIKYAIHVSDEQGLWPIFPNGLTPDNKISIARYRANLKEIDYEIDVNKDKLPQAIYTETLDEAIAILKAEGWHEPEEYLNMLQRQGK